MKTNMNDLFLDSTNKCNLYPIEKDVRKRTNMGSTLIKPQ